MEACCSWGQTSGGVELGGVDGKELHVLQRYQSNMFKTELMIILTENLVRRVLGVMPLTIAIRNIFDTRSLPLLSQSLISSCFIYMWVCPRPAAVQLTCLHIPSPGLLGAFPPGFHAFCPPPLFCPKASHDSAIMLFVCLQCLLPIAFCSLQGPV